MTNNLKLIVNNDHPDYLGMLDRCSEYSKEGKIRGLALVYIDNNDNIHTHYAKSINTLLSELLGTLEVLRSDIMDELRGK